MAIKLDGVLAQVTDGKIDTNKKNNASEEQASNKLGYDQFLQLLCAEMQNQDPLEPTSNTDYVAQMATFSQLEASLSMQTALESSQKTSELGMANSLVGKTVVVKDGNSPTGFANGTVDYVMKKDGNLMISVNDALYSLDALDTVANDEYYEAIVTGKTINNMISSLPDFSELTGSYQSAIQQIRDLYDGMSDYQKSFVSKDDISKLERYERLVESLVEKEKAEASEGESGDETGRTDVNNNGDDVIE